MSAPARLLAACVVIVGASAPYACIRRSPPPPAEPDVVVIVPPLAVDDYHAACANLRAHACPEGFGFDGGDTCEHVLQHVVETHLTTVSADCIARATTDEEFHACRVRCSR